MLKKKKNDYRLKSVMVILSIIVILSNNISKSNRYIIIDEIQALSFMLCHLYVRCTRSVSLPAPVGYAGLLGTRAMSYLTKDYRG